MEYCISRISNEIYEIEDEININEDEVEKLSNSIKIAKLDMLRRLFYLEYKSKEAQYLYIKSIKNNKISPKLRRRKQFKNNNTYLLHNA
jgi:transcription antitermination factor NusA-like protein